MWIKCSEGDQKASVENTKNRPCIVCRHLPTSSQSKGAGQRSSDTTAPATKNKNKHANTAKKQQETKRKKKKQEKREEETKNTKATKETRIKETVYHNHHDRKRDNNDNRDTDDNNDNDNNSAKKKKREKQNHPSEDASFLNYLLSAQVKENMCVLLDAFAMPLPWLVLKLTAVVR